MPGTFFCIFKAVGLTALPAKPFLGPKTAEHDVTLTWFAGNLSQCLEKFLVKMCKIDAREGTESLVTIGAAVLEIIEKSGGGQK